MDKTYYIPAGAVRPHMTIEYMGDQYEVVDRELYHAPQDRVLVVLQMRPAGQSIHGDVIRRPFHDATLMKVDIHYGDLPLSDLTEDMKASEYARVMSGKPPLCEALAPRRPS